MLLIRDSPLSRHDLININDGQFQCLKRDDHQEVISIFILIQIVELYCNIGYPFLLFLVVTMLWKGEKLPKEERRQAKKATHHILLRKVQQQHPGLRSLRMLGKMKHQLTQEIRQHMFLNLHLMG